jgi:hypothetical protein
MPVIDAAFHGAEDALLEAGARARIVHMPDLGQLPSDFRPDRLDGVILTGAMVNQFAQACDTPGLLSIPLPHLATFDIHARKIGALGVRQLAIQIAEHSRVRSGASEVQQVSCRVVVRPTFIPGESVRELTNSKTSNGRLAK